MDPCRIKVCPVGEDRVRFGREDAGIYDETNTRFEQYRRAWTHVRSYGGR